MSLPPKLFAAAQNFDLDVFRRTTVTASQAVEIGSIWPEIVPELQIKQSDRLVYSILTNQYDVFPMEYRYVKLPKRQLHRCKVKTIKLLIELDERNLEQFDPVHFTDRPHRYLYVSKLHGNPEDYGIRANLQHGVKKNVENSSPLARHWKEEFEEIDEDLSDYFD